MMKIMKIHNNFISILKLLCGYMKMLPVGKTKYAIRGTHIFNTCHCIDSILPKQINGRLYGTFYQQPFFKFHQFQSFYIEGIWIILFICSFCSPLEFLARVLARSLVCIWCMYVCVRARLHLWWFSALVRRSHAYI